MEGYGSSKMCSYDWAEPIDRIRYVDRSHAAGFK